MRGPIEFEKLFKDCEKRWRKEIEKRRLHCKKEHSFLTDERFNSIFISRIKRRNERLIAILDMKHKQPSGLRRNSFLSELFAEAANSPGQYRINPFGNFFKLEYPNLKRKHKEQMLSHPNRYKYRTDSINWDIDTVIDWCALSYTLKNYLNLRQEDKTRPKKLSEVINEKLGMMNSSQLAKYLGKSPGTITRWMKDTNIPHKRLNGRAMFSREEIDEWIISKQ